jgi:hypothetical protein
MKCFKRDPLGLRWLRDWVLWTTAWVWDEASGTRVCVRLMVSWDHCISWIKHLFYCFNNLADTYQTLSLSLKLVRNPRLSSLWM